MKSRIIFLSLLILIFVGSEIQFHTNAQENNSQNQKEISVNVPQLEELKSLIMTSNESNEKLFWVSVIIAGSTITGTFLSVKYVRKEIRERLRPRIIIESPKPARVVLANGQGVLLWKTWSDQNFQPPCETVTVVITIKNIGRKVAKNVTKYFTLQEEKFDKETFDNSMVEELDKYTLPELAPTQEYYQEFDISWADWAQKGDNIFVGIRIAYDTGFGTSYSSGIYQIEKGSTYIISGWYID